MMTTRLATTIGILAVMACAAFQGPRATYVMPLTAVERPEDVAQRYGEYQLQDAEDGIQYRDDLVSILVVARSGSFLLTIENVSEHSIALVWDEAAYVGPDGTSSPVSSGETRCIDVGRSQRPPEVIPRTATAIVTAMPNANLYTRYGGGCGVRDFVTVADSARVQELENKTVRLVLPLRVRDTVNEYTLVFHLQQVRVGMPGDSL